MPSEKEIRRMDFKQEITEIDEENGTYKFRLTPDPERYELRKVDGEECYYDKFDDIFIPLSVVKNLASQMIGKPIYYSKPKINDANKYINERIPHIRGFFIDEQKEYNFVDASEDFLNSLEKDQMRFVILSIDLKGSTKMSQELSPEIYSDIIELFQREITMAVDMFNGFVLNHVGDGLIAYFPEPNSIGMHDNAIDCAMTMKKIVMFGINPILKERSLPELIIRIGLDSGEAIIKTLGSKKFKLHKDLIGETVNLAAKIQGVAGPNQIMLGESTVMNVHTFWRKKIKLYENLEKWNYKNKQTGEIYPIYYLIERW